MMTDDASTGSRPQSPWVPSADLGAFAAANVSGRKPRTVVDLVLAHAARAPEHRALVLPRPGGPAGFDEVVTYGALARRMDEFRAGLRKAGLREGDRVLLLVAPSVDFYALALAVFAEGGSLVTLDGSLGLARATWALAIAGPRIVVAPPSVLRLWPALPPLWRALRFVDGTPLPGCTPMAALRVDGASSEPPRARAALAEAMLSFTSGTSGRPKGVERTHGVLLAQFEALVEEYPHPPTDVYLTTFPALALHNLCCGITTVLPPGDLRRPASIDGAAVLATMRRWGVNLVSAAPAFASRLAAAAAESGTPYRGLRSLGIGGAPVPRRLVRAVMAHLPCEEGLVLFGSTEAEPIAKGTFETYLASTGERGFYAGRPARRTELALTSGIIPQTLDGRELAPYAVHEGNVGELFVRGAHVPARYVGNAEAEREVKRVGPGGTWHRTKDLAYRDARGELWLAGRVGDEIIHRGRTVFPCFVEARVLDVEGVARAAVVAHANAPEGELLVEAVKDTRGAERLRTEIPAALESLELSTLPWSTVPSIPVDARHQSKVARTMLVESRLPAKRRGPLPFTFFSR